MAGGILADEMVSQAFRFSLTRLSYSQTSEFQLLHCGAAVAAAVLLTAHVNCSASANMRVAG